MNSLRQAQMEMVEAGGRTAQTFGLNRLLGQIYILLYLSPEALSLDELSAQLGVSKASVSIAGRQLESWGALHRVWKRGDRKDYYEAETDFGRLLNNGFLDSINRKLDSAKIQIERSLNLVSDSPDSDDQTVKFVRERLKQAEQYRSRINSLLNNPFVKKLM